MASATPVETRVIGDGSHRGRFGTLSASNGATIAPSVTLPAAQAFTGDYATLSNTPIDAAGAYTTNGSRVTDMRILATEAPVTNSGTATVYATVGGTANGAAIFNDISSIQVTGVFASVSTFNGMLCTVKSVSTDLKTIVVSASTNSRPASNGTVLYVLFYGPSTSLDQPYICFTRFNDGTTFLWNPVKPPSTAIWSGRFNDQTSSLPTAYLSIAIMNNQAGNVWAWPSVSNTATNTFSPPTGSLTLGALMNSMYASTTATITASQYQDICGQDYTGSGPCTVGAALQANADAWGYPQQWNGISKEGTNVFRINC